MKGKIVIFSGPSGVGKDTLLNAWMAADERVRRVVACTSRKPRDGEVDGVDYHFVTSEDFLHKVERDEFLEWEEVHGRHYGTPRAGVGALIAEGKFAVLKIDVKGAMRVMREVPDAISIFILAPSLEELERRIRGRGLDDDQDIAVRLLNAHDELGYADKYRYRVVNDELNRAIRELEEILERECAG